MIFLVYPCKFLDFCLHFSLFLLKNCLFFVSVEIFTGGIFGTITAVFKEKNRIDHILTNFHKVGGRKVGGRKYTSVLKMFKERDNLNVTCKFFLTWVLFITCF